MKNEQDGVKSEPSLLSFVFEDPTVGCSNDPLMGYRNDPLRGGSDIPTVGGSREPGGGPLVLEQRKQICLIATVGTLLRSKTVGLKLKLNPKSHKLTPKSQLPINLKS